MGQSSQRHSTKSSASSHDSQRSSKSGKSSRSSKSRKGRRSNESYDSQSTAPTSVSSSRRPSVNKAPKLVQVVSSEDDLSPSTSRHARSSTETYDSRLASDEDMEDVEMGPYNDYPEIPPLPDYRRPVTDHSVRPSNPQDFAHLFPSMNRLSIRHDDFTSDGNMNLRVETLAPGRRAVTMQLFHLRMYDLAKREFSLRRYCRESGREVCNSKRKYEDQPSTARPTLQRSVSTAFKNLAHRQPSGDSNSGNLLFGSKSSYSERRPNSSGSSTFADDEFNDYFSHSMSLERKPKTKPAATNTIKLEFSNYARVDVSRKGSGASKHYDFEWWGHKYTWKREVDKNFGSISFHLYRSGTSAPVAHIVPEIRSPTQVQADENANGWVPPCYMWISDKSMIDTMTDKTDVVVATGLMALVDDCIKSRWPAKKASRTHLPLTGNNSATPMAFVRNVLPRRQSSYTPRPIATY